MPRPLGCIIRPEVRTVHAALTTEARALLPAWSRIVGTPRICAGNDRIGDCAIVAAINAVQTRLSLQGNFTPIPDALGPQIYSAVTGYVPGVASTDNGTDPEQLFAWWRDNAIAGYKLRDFTRINPANVNAIRNAIVSFGAYLCLDLTDVQEQSREWLPTGNHIGGHAVWGDAYSDRNIGATSWGEEVAIDQTTFTTPGYVAMAYSLDLVAA